MRTAGAHLTYCTNIHPGESYAEVRDNLANYVRAVRERVAPGRPFGVGLRLSARAASELSAPAVLEELKDFLRSNELYVFTLNGFPYGPFHGQPVKDGVYRPDWTAPERLGYTDELARLLAELLPDGMAGSVSTVPLGFKGHLTSEGDVSVAVDQLLRHVAVLHRLRQDRGREVALCLEPEPCCVLETIEETTSFFEGELFSRSAREKLAGHAGVGQAEAEALIRRHLGVCLDTCHAAVEFEDPKTALASLKACGIRIAKAQLSTGLRLPQVTPATLEALRRYDESVYLHQVVARTGAGRLERYADLPQAFASESARAAREWRVHFHVPLHREKLEGFVNTQPFLAEVLELQRSAPFTEHLEVETYTWDVLPAEHRGESVVVSVARELEWVLERLGA